MEGRVALITGASDGVGEQAARALAARGWTVGVIGRTESKARRVADELGMPYYVADFASLSAVRELALRLRADFPRVDVLANNAGGIFSRQARTADGHEITHQVNHLAHFLLTRLMLDRLLESRAAVVNTSSVAHKLIGFNFDVNDLDMRRHRSQHLAYGNAKLCNILFSSELHRRFHAAGLSAASFHPGMVATSFARGTASPMNLFYHTGLRRLLGLIPPEEGADTLVWLAEGTPGRDWESGKYYVRRKETMPSRKARDAGLARALWEKSEAACAPFLAGAQ